jgi:TonB family protein
MSPIRRVSVAAALALVVSGTTAGIARVLPFDMPASIAQTKPAPRLEIRLAEDSPGAGLTEAVVSESQRRIYLHPTALVTNADVASARVVSENRGGLLSHSVAVTFNSAATGRVTAATSAHLGKPLAILIDGRIVAVPVVRDAIGTSAVINGNFTAEQAKALVDGLAPSDRRATLVKGPGAGIIMPVPLTRINPEYTSAAMTARIQGVVVMTAVVKADGTVGDVQVTKSLDKELGLDDQAVAAVRQWKFRPGTKNGEPVAVQVVIETEFTLRK